MTSPYQELLQRLGVTVTNADIKRLKSHLSGWVHLNELLVADFFTTEDIKKLIVIELNDRARRQILDKLCARLSTKQLEHLRDLVAACIKAKK